MGSVLTVAAAVEANLTVGEVVEAKMREMADLLQATSPTSALEQEYVDWLMQETARGFPAGVLAGLIALCPRVELGETCGAYAARLIDFAHPSHTTTPKGGS
ncbi:hypothetical protein [Streptomyces sp. NPDC047070]|uniref:hypothetical protein n=1 Tax=Streptomyces sp. NPDC047070 TaxID=3154923 RepID=UPI003453A54A